jgi:photosystem II stability/assembly factor-like uncharacterized protein
MKTLIKHLASTVMVLAFCGACIAGPTVVVHPKSASVTIRDSKFDVVQELKDPKQIKLVQDAFLRAKRIGDTATKLKSATHKIDFSDRWLVDMKSGEIGVLTKVVTDVYQLDPKDLAALKSLLEPEAEHVVGGNGG